MENPEDSTVIVEVTIKVPNGNGELEAVLSTSGKLTKADATRVAQEQIYIHIQPGEDSDYAKAVVSVNYQGKLNEANLVS